MAFKFDIKATLGKAADAMFAMALVDTTTFYGAARPILLGHSDGDILKAQELVLEGLQDHIHVVQAYLRRDAAVHQAIGKNGAPDTIRTCGLCLRRAALYPAELRVLTARTVAEHVGRVKCSRDLMGLEMI